ncbi:MAG: formylglycine-generating enzyme family protein [Vampirovibrionia bacterium]
MSILRRLTMRWGIIAALVLGCGFCAADEIDLEAVRGTLDTAVDTYFEEIIELDKEITERIDKLIEMASNRGDLNAVDELERQREAYLRTGFMPEGRIHLVTRRKAEFGINRAKSRLDQAYEEAIEVLTKEGRFTDARRIRSERLNLEQKLSAAQPELQPTNIISQARERKVERGADLKLPVIAKQEKPPVQPSSYQTGTYQIHQKNENWCAIISDGVLIGGYSGSDVSGKSYDLVGGCHVGNYLIFSLKKHGHGPAEQFHTYFGKIINGELFYSFSEFSSWTGEPEDWRKLNSQSPVNSVSIGSLDQDSIACLKESKEVENKSKIDVLSWADGGDIARLLIRDRLVVGGVTQGGDVGEPIGGYFDGKRLSFLVRRKIQKDQYCMYFGEVSNNSINLLQRVWLREPLDIEDIPVNDFKNLKFSFNPATEADMQYLRVGEGTTKNIDDFKLKSELGPAYTNSIGMKLRAIPPGQFLMQGTTKATITNPFYIGVYEVTQKEWKAVMGSLPENTKTEGDDMPAQGVSWNSAAEFCQKLSNMPDEKANGCVYRLPTETEWEYACRAGTNTEYFFGDDASKLGEYAWYHDNSEGHIHPVGTKHPNPAGLYDINGNVIEWCIDWYNEFPPVMIDYIGQKPKLTGHGSKSKVVRGASFI